MSKECNLHCDVCVTVEKKHTLPPFEYLDSFWIMRSQQSRHRDKGLLERVSGLSVGALHAGYLCLQNIGVIFCVRAVDVANGIT